MYILQRNSDGKCVAKPGLHNSYTLNINNIRIFKTREDAERDACGNERVVRIEELRK